MKFTIGEYRSGPGVALVLVALMAACGAPTTGAPTLTAPPTVTHFIPTPTAGDALATPPYSIFTNQEISPNGQWLVVTVRVSPTGNDPSPGMMTQLKVMQVAGTLEWVLMDRWMPYRSGFEGWNAFYWTEDGRYLYFADWWAPDGCAIFLDNSDWLRVELTTGKVDEIALSSTSFVVSPDRMTAAYVSNTSYPGAIGILDLRSRTERRLPLGDDELRSGNIVWAPDGSALAFVVIHNACQPGEETHSIERVDVSTLTRTTLVPDDQRRLFISEWNNINQIAVNDADGGRWLVDAQTGDMTKRAGTFNRHIPGMNFIASPP